MRRSRRSVLAATGSVLLAAGCTAPGSSPKLTLDASVTVAPEDPFGLTVSVRQSAITGQRAGRLAVTYHNTGTETTEVSILPPAPHPQNSETRSPGVLLEHPGDRIEQAESGHWMPDDDSISTTLEWPIARVPPGGQVSADYQLWADPAGKPEYDGLVPGTYEVPMPADAVLAVELTEP